MDISEGYALELAQRYLGKQWPSLAPDQIKLSVLR